MYYLKNQRSNRVRKTSHLILVPLHNTIEKNSFIDPDILLGSHYYTWGKVQKYFREELKKDENIFHYFIELIGKDYEIFKGMPSFYRSSFITNLVDHKIIDFKYRDAMIVGISEDFTIDMHEKRLNEKLAHYIITDYMRVTGNDFTTVKFFDEILLSNYEEMLKIHELPYTFKKSIYFDKFTLELECKKFKK